MLASFLANGVRSRCWRHKVEQGSLALEFRQRDRNNPLESWMKDLIEEAWIVLSGLTEVIGAAWNKWAWKVDRSSCRPEEASITLDRQQPPWREGWRHCNTTIVKRKSRISEALAQLSYVWKCWTCWKTNRCCKFNSSTKTLTWMTNNKLSKSFQTEAKSPASSKTYKQRFQQSWVAKSA